MTKSTITRERLELIANFHRAMVLPPSHDEIEELARIALAAMDSEPVAWVVGGDEIDDFNRGREVMVMRDCDDEDLENLPLYRHAQPAPVIPLEMTACQAYDLLIKKGGVMSPVDAAVFAWNACRAAMLAAAPQEVKGE